MNSSTCRWRVVSGPPVGPGTGVGAGRAAMEKTLTRSRVRGKHPFVFSLDLERLFVQGECLTRMVRCPGQVPTSGSTGREVERFEMVAALQAPPRVRTRARVVPLRLVPDQVRPDQLQPERVVVVRRQPRPRVTRSKRAIYMRRRV